MASIEVMLFGSPQVTLDGEPVSMDTRKAIALLAYLAVTGQMQQRDRLAAFFWPESDQPHARAALRRTLSTLNNVLRGGELIATRDAIGLERQYAQSVDVHRFRRAISQARVDDSVAELEHAAAIQHDEFMAGFHLRDSPEFDDWCYLVAEELRRDLAWALERLASIHGDRNNLPTAIAHAVRWLALDPLHEAAHRRLMSLYARAGQTAAAVRQYRDCVRILERELGVEPLAATTALYQSIQENRLSTHQPAEEGVETSLSGPGSASPDRLEHTFVGRDAELARLMAAFEEHYGNGHLVAVEGEAGIGKSRLVQAFLDEVRERGHRSIVLRCHEGESQLTFGPVVDALKPLVGSGQSPLAESLDRDIKIELGRLFPGLLALHAEAQSPAPLDSPGARSRFYDALLDTLQIALGGGETGVIFIDDLQWIDEASLDLLTYLVHRLKGRPFVVLAWRTDDLPPDHRLRTLLAGSLGSGDAMHISLGTLTRRDVELLAREITRDTEAAAGLGVRLYEETNGLPFFVIQYLDELRHRRHDLASDSWPVPGGIRDLLRARLSSVSSEEHQILTTLSAIGSPAPFSIVEKTSGRSVDETIDALDQLTRRGLVVERDSGLFGNGEPLFDVSHDKLRDVIYDDMSLLRRRLLHGRIAGVLRDHAVSPPQRTVFALIAHHLRLAGQDASAAGAYRDAGDVAFELYANQEAISHYESALALGHGDSGVIHERIGDLRMRLGDYELALASYEKAAALSPPEAIAEIEHKLGNLYQRLGEWARAESHYATAENLLATEGGVVDPGAHALFFADWSLLAHRTDKHAYARELGDRALDLAGRSGDLRAIAMCHNLIGVLTRQVDGSASREHLEECLRLTRRLNAPEVEVAVLNNLALSEHSAGHHVRAIELGRQALALAQQQGDRHRQAALHSNLADVLHSTGDSAAAMEHLRQSATIYADIGVVAGEPQAEIWKLAEW